jgi:hypothetical protein
LRKLETDRPGEFHSMFGHADPRRFALQKPATFHLAERIEDLAPGGGNDGPNPEYPWPPTNPTAGPLTHAFPEWRDWSETTPGRRLRGFVERMLDSYSVYSP